NDKENITAEFNKNILLVMNELLKTNFNSNDFCHHAFYNEFFAKGESIHTENSRKFNLLDLEEIANYSQLKISKIYTDSQSYFSLVSFSKGS
ncbi:MAG: L-histidine N(alpha)-methyltransferase, partial [Bacteroidetes bacterium 4572_77]